MHDGIQRAGDVEIITDIVFDEGEPRVSQQVCHVIHGAGHKIIHADDLMPHADQSLAEMAAQKPCPTRNQNAHAPSYPRSTKTCPYRIRSYRSITAPFTSDHRRCSGLPRTVRPHLRRKCSRFFAA